MTATTGFRLGIHSFAETASSRLRSIQNQIQNKHSTGNHTNTNIHQNWNSSSSSSNISNSSNNGTIRKPSSSSDSTSRTLSMSSSSAATTSTRSSSPGEEKKADDHESDGENANDENADGRPPEEEEDDDHDGEHAGEPPPPYTLREHCHHLKLRTETFKDQQSWYCDRTDHFVPIERQRQLVKDVVKDYCQPFRTLSELQDQTVGIASLSLHTEDPLPVRTLSIHLRPDSQHFSILEAVHEAFSSLHDKHYYILKSSLETFQAIGADGATPYFVSAFVAVHNQNLERRLWIRFYHVESVPLMEEALQAIGGLPQQKAPLRDELTPINTRLSEASAVVQHILGNNLAPGAECPGGSTEPRYAPGWFPSDPSRAAAHFRDPRHTIPSVSVLEESQNLARHRAIRGCFPSLAAGDRPVLQESAPLVDRIWSELELRRCTFNTLVEESSSRFGMRPNQSNLDKAYCFQLSQISQQHMLLDLQSEIANAEQILHNTLGEYQELETLLIYVLRRKYNVPTNADGLGGGGTNTQEPPTEDHVFNSLDIGQAPIRMNKRKLSEFPWHDDVRVALEEVATKIAEGCLHEYDPEASLAMAHDAVDHVYTAFGRADDSDLRGFLKRRNRQAMIRVAQQQARLKRLLEEVILAPTRWPGLPKLTTNVSQWYEISLNAKTSNLRRHPVPLTEFRTKTGQGCITAHQLILVSGFLSTRVDVYDWMDIDVKHTPKHPLTKIAILENGKKVYGFNPTNMDAQKLVSTIHVLKGLQEA